MSQETVSHAAEFVQPYGPGQIETVEPRYARDDPLRRSNRLTKKSWKLILARTVLDFAPLALMDRGATMTYFSVTAFAPMLLAFYSTVTLLFPADENELRDMVGGLIDEAVPEALREQAFDLFVSVVGTPAQSTVALVISLLVSLLAASAYVRAFSRSTNVIYGRMEGRGLPVTWLTMWAITLLLVVGLVVVVAALVLRESVINAVLGPIAEPLGLTGALDYLNQILLPVWEWARYPAVVVAAVVLVTCLFYFAPNVRPGRFRLLTVGAVFAMLVIGAEWALFGVYLSIFGLRSAYGAFGTVLTVLVAVWAMNIVLLLGVKLDAEILRAKELQAGYDSEVLIQAPPRSQDAVLFQRKVRLWLHRLAEDVKEEAASKRHE
ncbi:membrane protein [Corynebacterium appendicis CIP 107643]|uniref:Membrane protein n=1 Tax=Corynebacterium appendicis CIP 107643 TaxID=1161099 RepID=A0A1N7JEB2_9CORY|nr:YihY/virulence factor BrkB family protein [Corynebacterium appendicis]WJY60671.1 Ribonuclease BN-like family protein [Corynebacterium appendicis CIP 107643]SIS47639.1 membrane protein [Corynebacterium appendicis CIP 107643]